MNKLSLVLMAILLGSMVVFYAPGIFALNRGRVLRNIALWLAIFAGLGLIYQNFGPESPHPLFSTPASRANMNIELNAPAPPENPPQIETAPASNDSNPTPPKE